MTVDEAFRVLDKVRLDYRTQAYNQPRVMNQQVVTAKDFDEVVGYLRTQFRRSNPCDEWAVAGDLLPD